MNRKPKMPLAYSYLRFSTPELKTGDSIRRQVEQTAAWCKQNKAQLDESITYRDDGVSAFRGQHRENADIHKLASFVNAVKSGRIPKGSFLVVESLDRLSREKIRPALTLLLNLIESGVKVVQLQPVEKVYDEDVDPMALMMAVMELNRGHSESAMKSVRVGAAWASKRKHAKGKAVTRKLPGWIRAVGGEGKEMKNTAPGEVRFELIPERARTVRRVFELAHSGLGVHRIAERLNADRVPVLGRAVFRGRPVVWNETVVYHQLTTRAVIGEYQPCQGRGSTRTPAGDPIPNYFPAAIDADLFHAVQGLMKARATCGTGRRGKHVNLFAGLLKDARDGGSLTYKHVSNRSSALIPVNSKHGHGSIWSSFLVEQFEEAVLSRLREVKVSDVRGENEAAGRVEAIAGELAGVDDLIRQWTAKMDDPATVDIVATKLAELNGRRKRLAENLADAQRDAASPLSESWGEFRTLAELLKSDPSDELRAKVRTALRRSIESVHCLFTPPAGDVRLAAVRVQFRGSALHRDYVIGYSTGQANAGVKRASKPWSEAAAWQDGPGELDLRDPKNVPKVEKMLAGLKIDRSAGAVRE
jgi:DNA invertase Pin-like site-specific DNA recombinase